MAHFDLFMFLAFQLRFSKAEIGTCNSMLLSSEPICDVFQSDCINENKMLQRKNLLVELLDTYTHFGSGAPQSAQHLFAGWLRR